MTSFLFDSILLQPLFIALLVRFLHGKPVENTPYGLKMKESLSYSNEAVMDGYDRLVDQMFGMIEGKRSIDWPAV